METLTTLVLEDALEKFPNVEFRYLIRPEVPLEYSIFYKTKIT